MANTKRGLDVRELISSQNLKNDTYESIITKLNARPQIVNPVPKGKVPKKPTAPGLLAVLKKSPTFQADLDIVKKVIGLVQLGNTLASALPVTNEGSIDRFLTELTDNGLPTATLNAIKAELSAVIDDPDYQSTVPGESLASAAGLGTVTGEDIQEAFKGWQ